MDRTEGAGLGIAVAAHLALLGLLSIGFLAAPKPIRLEPPPVEVVLTDDVGLVSAAPDASDEEPAAKLAEVEGPVEPNQPPPPQELPPAPQPEIRQPAPAPAPQPAPVPKPAPTPAKRVPPARPAPPAPAKPAPARPAPVKAAPAKPAPAKPAPARPPAAKPAREARPTGRLDGITSGLNDRPSTSMSTKPKAATVGQAKKTINAAIGQEIKPHWKIPSGIDVEKLVTKIRFQLNQDGTLAGEPVVLSQSGETASNAPQKKRHAENAIKAIKLAAPFKLDPQYYDQWRTWTFDFDARLNQ